MNKLVALLSTILGVVIVVYNTTHGLEPMAIGLLVGCVGGAMIGIGVVGLILW